MIRSLTVALVVLVVSAAEAGTLPPGFQETVVASGLVAPTQVAFAPDGRMFVAEKNGRIQVYDAPGDPTPTLFADLRRRRAHGWKLATLRQPRQGTNACSNTLRYVLASGGGAIMATPAGRHFRQTLEVGDDCATALLDCDLVRTSLICEAPPP